MRWSPYSPLDLRRAPATAPAAARALLHLLTSLRHGRLDVQLPDGSQSRFGDSDAAGSHAAIRLLNWNVCAETLKSGDIGFAESYVAGDWTTPDLPALMKLIVANRDAVGLGLTVWDPGEVRVVGVPVVRARCRVAVDPLVADAKRRGGDRRVQVCTGRSDDVGDEWFGRPLVLRIGIANRDGRVVDGDLDQSHRIRLRGVATARERGGQCLRIGMPLRYCALLREDRWR